MRAIWKGAVSFGLVNVPVRLYAATENHDIRFHQVHAEDGGRIRYKRTCTECGKEIDYQDIVKGYETSEGELVTITNDELSELPLPTGHEVDVVEFVDSAQVDPMLLDRSYYLEPESRGLKAYALLREALQATDRMAIAKIALRKRETLAALHVRGKAMVLQTMRWPDEIRSADFEVLDEDVTVRKQEVQMASSLVDQMSADFEPSEFEDEYARAVEELVAKKAAGGDVTDVAESGGAAEDAEVVYLMSALQKSIDVSSKKQTAKKSNSPQKQSAKKSSSANKSTSAKKTTKKKSGGKKSV